MLCMILGSCCVTTLYNVFHKVSFLVGVQRFLFLFLQPHQQICERGLKLNKCNLLRVCRADSGVQFVNLHVVMKSYYQCWPVNLVILTASSLPLPLYHLPFILESYFSFLNPRVVTHWIFLSVCSFDGVPFLMHDSTLKRTTNIAEVFPNRTHLDASMFTWTELQQLNAGDWFLSVWPTRTQLNTEQQQHVVGLEMHHLYRNYWKKHIPTDI